MVFPVYARILGLPRARWTKAIILGLLAFFIFFLPDLLFKILTYEISGFRIISVILGILIAFMAWDAKIVG